ncbi:MAG: succinyldiaminopimelate transaminase [Cellvibrionaceae bacterium]
MNPRLEKLQPYPFEKLSKLKASVTANSALPHIAWSIGEPKHSPPQFVLDIMAKELPSICRYPMTKGLPELRQSIVEWTTQRFKLKPNTLTAEEHVLPVNGTREALFAFAQAMIDPSTKPLVMMPNPFYQIYEGAALLAGAEPYYLNCVSNKQYLPELEKITEKEWQRCQLFYICSPNNPSGSVFKKADYIKLLELADRYNFIIASDECYSEIYPDDKNPPIGLLEVCADIGRDNFERCVVFHSLSKRSNLPGLRSGFVAGDAKIIKHFLQYRTYHGCAMSLPTQLASISAWSDEEHVIHNRTLYREKFNTVANILKHTWALEQPEAGFNFWAKTPIDDEKFAQQLFEKQNITVLPGSYLSRTAEGINPGENYVRMALVAPIEECKEAANRINTFLQTQL